MYKIVLTSKYRRSIKKLKKSGKSIDKDLGFVIDELATGRSLPQKFRDHKLTGELQDFRECHIKFDLLLVYKIHKRELILVLIDIGSHDGIFSK